MTDLLDRYVPQIEWPACETALARIDVFEIDEAKARKERLYSIMSFTHRGRGVPAGTYRRLSTAYRDGWVMQMSDTPDERYDQLEFVRRARGRVLVTGLGLGLTVNALLLRECVEHVTVLEINQGVIDLVQPLLLDRYGSERLTVKLADALEYMPGRGEHYDCIWHDIWPDICIDNKPQYTLLARRWAHRVPQASAQQFWAKEYLF